MIGICKNGHMTGQRHCGTCGADRKQFSPGAGEVQVERHERPCDEHGKNELDALRRSTRHASGPLGPNKTANGEMPRPSFL
jgi:hypothetical protein